jgi:hypothetical protein
MEKEISNKSLISLRNAYCLNNDKQFFICLILLFKTEINERK